MGSSKSHLSILNQKVFSCEMHHRPLASPQAGDIVGLNVKGLDKADMPKVGDVMMLHKRLVIPNCSRFSALVQVLNPRRGLTIGYSPLCYVHAARAHVCLRSIQWRQGVDRVKMDNPAELRPRDLAEATFDLQRPLAIQPFDMCPTLGRIIFMEGTTEVMLGKVIHCHS